MNGIQNIDCQIGLQKLPDESIDLVVTSPPYGGLRRYNGFSWDFETVAELLFEKVRAGGIVAWNTGDEIKKGVPCLYPERQLLHFTELGFRLWETIFWEKHGVPCPTPNRYYNVIERVFILSKGEPTTFNPITDRPNVSHRRRQQAITRTAADCRKKSERGYYQSDLFGRRTNVWTYVPQPNDTGHPAVMPEKLAGDLILSYSNEGDLICDPFAGAGTTFIAAEKLRRRCVGFEISPDYVATAKRRIDVLSHLLF